MEKQINLTGGVIYNQDCLKGLKEIKDKQFDVAITSPPYNRVRNDKYAHYDDVKNNYYKMIVDVTNELLRVCKKDVIVNIQATYIVNFDTKHKMKYLIQLTEELGYSIEDIHKRFMENAEIKRLEYDVKKMTETNLGLEKY